MEVNDAGNVDDVILRSDVAPNRYMQVKWAARSSALVDMAYLLNQPGNGKSLLGKFFYSWQLLKRDTLPPQLELVTNRGLDRGDPLLALCDGRSDLLTPAARTISATSAAGRQLREWAKHLGVGTAQVLDMLDRLVFRTGRTVSAELERAEALMIGAGLRADETAIRLGTATVAAWVRAGRRRLSLSEIENEIDELGLYEAAPRAVLLVQGIARDPHPDDATVSVDWVDHFIGDSPPNRRRPKTPASWSTMADDLAAVTADLRDAGYRDVLVRGAMRQATFFAVGACLARVTGTTVSYIQNRVLWSSESPRAPVSALDVRRTRLDQGNDLAVALGVAVDPSDAVVHYLTEAHIPVRELVTLLPNGGPHDQAVAGPGQAVAFSQELRNHVRTELERAAAEKVHLFLAGPGGLALLTGQRWNRVAPTVVYEDLGPGQGYMPTFAVDA